MVTVGSISSVLVCVTDGARCLRIRRDPLETATFSFWSPEGPVPSRRLEVSTGGAEGSPRARGKSFTTGEKEGGGVIGGTVALDTDVLGRLAEVVGVLVSGTGVDGGTLALSGRGLGLETGLNTALPFSAEISVYVASMRRSHTHERVSTWSGPLDNNHKQWT